MTIGRELVSLETLELRNATLSSIHVEPGKRVSIRVFTFGEHDQDPNGGKEYEVLLAKVAAFRFTSLHLPSRIQAHTVKTSSPFIVEARKAATRDPSRLDPLRLQHYELITDSGQIDIASEIAGALAL